jgi:hypothetical protein
VIAPTCAISNGAPFLASPSGGIVFKDNKQIKTIKETLKINWKEIVVNYEFFNEDKIDYDENIAFPLQAWNTIVPFGEGGVKYQYFFVSDQSANFSPEIQHIAWVIQPNGKAIDITHVFKDQGIDPEKFNNEMGGSEKIYKKISEYCVVTEFDYPDQRKCRVVI